MVNTHPVHCVFWNVRMKSFIEIPLSSSKNYFSFKQKCKYSVTIFQVIVYLKPINQSTKQLCEDSLSISAIFKVSPDLCEQNLQDKILKIVTQGSCTNRKGKANARLDK